MIRRPLFRTQPSCSSNGNAHADQGLDRARGEAVAADLFPREAGLLQDQHVHPGPGQVAGRGRAGRPGPHHDHVGFLGGRGPGRGGSRGGGQGGSWAGGGARDSRCLSPALLGRAAPGSGRAAPDRRHAARPRQRAGDWEGLSWVTEGCPDYLVNRFTRYTSSGNSLGPSLAAPANPPRAALAVPGLAQPGYPPSGASGPGACQPWPGWRQPSARAARLVHGYHAQAQVPPPYCRPPGRGHPARELELGPARPGSTRPGSRRPPGCRRAEPRDRRAARRVRYRLVERVQPRPGRRVR